MDVLNHVQVAGWAAIVVVMAVAIWFLSRAYKNWMTGRKIRGDEDIEQARTVNTMVLASLTKEREETEKLRQQVSVLENRCHSLENENRRITEEAQKKVDAIQAKLTEAQKQLDEIRLYIKQQTPESKGK